jgi:hypothetical protein
MNKSPPRIFSPPEHANRSISMTGHYPLSQNMMIIEE